MTGNRSRNGVTTLFRLRSRRFHEWRQLPRLHDPSGCPFRRSMATRKRPVTRLVSPQIKRDEVRPESASKWMNPAKEHRPAQSQQIKKETAPKSGAREAGFP